MLHLKLVQNNQTYTREEARKIIGLSQESFSTYFASYGPMQADLINVGKKRVAYPGDVLNRRIQQLVSSRIAICDDLQKPLTQTNNIDSQIKSPHKNNSCKYTLTNFVTYGINANTFDVKKPKYTRIIDQLPNESVIFDPKVTYNKYVFDNASYITHDWQLIDDAELVRQVFSQAGSLVGYDVTQLFINNKTKQLIAFSKPYLAQEISNYCDYAGKLAVRDELPKNNLRITNMLLNSMLSNKVKKPLFTVVPPTQVPNCIFDQARTFSLHNQLQAYGHLLPRLFSTYYINATIKYLSSKNFDLINKADALSLSQHHLYDNMIAMCDYAKNTSADFNRPHFYQDTLDVDYNALKQAEILNRALYKWNAMWQQRSLIDDAYNNAKKQLHHLDDPVSNDVFLTICTLKDIENITKSDTFNQNALLDDLPDLNTQPDILPDVLMGDLRKKANKLLKDDTFLNKFLKKLNSVLDKYKIKGELTAKQKEKIRKLLLSMQLVENTNFNYLAEEALIFQSLMTIINNNIEQNNNLKVQYQKQIPDIVETFINDLNHTLDGLNLFKLIPYMDD